MDEIVQEFLIESREGLDRLDQDLVALEKNPSDKERLASIFRAIHTIKGSSGFLGFNKLEEVAHVGENLLSKLRDGDVIFSPDLAHVLLAMIDAIRYMLDQIESTDLPGNKDFSELVGLLAKWSGESEEPDEAFPMVQSPCRLEGVPAAVSSVELAPAIPVASYTSTFTATSSLPPGGHHFKRVN
jgi:two-component system chemotaxis sensor kinase CheA